jgi:hypothetical protein
MAVRNSLESEWGRGNLLEAVGWYLRLRLPCFLDFGIKNVLSKSTFRTFLPVSRKQHS